MPHVREQSVVDDALACSDAGMRDADNAALHGVAIKTIRRWRRLYQRRGLPRGQAHLQARCPRCDDADLDRASYAELLGWYLGDGHISRGRRDVFTLHVYNDLRYPALNDRIGELMRAVKPGSRPHTRTMSGCLATSVGWKHWPCLFPQHGPGRKHERRIVLEDWQRDVVAEHPWELLRGLMHSDGSRVRNWATRATDGVTVRHDYARWQFVNASKDVLGICTDALDLVEVPWRRSGRRTVSVSRRAGVAAVDEHVGPKS